MSYAWQDNRNTAFVTVPGGLLPIITTMETGYHPVSWATQSYLATSKTEGRPGNIFAKIADDFYFHWGKTRQSFKVGAEYHYDWNDGRGYYNLDESHPLRPNSNGRPRAYSDIPGLHQLAAFVEDHFVWSPNRVNHLRAQLGLRFTTQQPFSSLGTTALSPTRQPLVRRSEMAGAPCRHRTQQQDAGTELSLSRQEIRRPRGRQLHASGC